MLRNTNAGISFPTAPMRKSTRPLSWFTRSATADALSPSTSRPGPRRRQEDQLQGVPLLKRRHDVLRHHGQKEGVDLRRRPRPSIWKEASRGKSPETIRTAQAAVTMAAVTAAIRPITTRPIRPRVAMSPMLNTPSRWSETAWGRRSAPAPPPSVEKRGEGAVHRRLHADGQLFCRSSQEDGRSDGQKHLAELSIAARLGGLMVTRLTPSGSRTTGPASSGEQVAVQVLPVSPYSPSSSSISAGVSFSRHPDLYVVAAQPGARPEAASGLRPSLLSQKPSSSSTANRRRICSFLSVPPLQSLHRPAEIRSMARHSGRSPPASLLSVIPLCSFAWLPSAPKVLVSAHSPVLNYLSLNIQDIHKPVTSKTSMMVCSHASQSSPPAGSSASGGEQHPQPAEEVYSALKSRESGFSPHPGSPSALAPDPEPSWCPAAFHRHRDLVPFLSC